MASDRPQARSWPPFRPRPRAARRRGREPTPTPPAPPEPFPSPRTATAPPSRFRRAALDTTNTDEGGSPPPSSRLSHLTRVGDASHLVQSPRASAPLPRGHVL